MDSKLIITVATLALTAMVSSADDVKKPAAPDREFKPSDAKFLNETERQEWLAEMRASLPIAHRAHGPFGMRQNPSAPIMKKKQAPVRSDAFLNAIGAIKVTAVLPSDDKFVIGSREFREGEVLPVIRGKRQFNVKIVSVTLDNILFQNVDTGEFVKRNMNTLPKGMSPNGKMGNIKGITPSGRGKAEPLNLDQ